MAQGFGQSSVGEDVDESVQEGQRKFEEMRQRLQDTLGRAHAQPFRPDPFCFPFVIVPRDGNGPTNAPAQVKLDSGSHDNWIGKHVRDRCNTQFEPTDGSKLYVGAGGGNLRPIGRVTLIWYSENAAKTSETTFLVGENLPFDVILGVDFIMESLAAFKTPAFPLREIFTAGQAYCFAFSQEKGLTEL